MGRSSVCVRGCRVRQGGNQIFQGAVWLRTECPTEMGHMLDIQLDWFDTVCSNLQYCPNAAEHPVSVFSSSSPVSLLFPSLVPQTAMRQRYPEKAKLYIAEMWNIKGFWSSYCSNFKAFLTFRAASTICFGSKIGLWWRTTYAELCWVYYSLKSVLGSVKVPCNHLFFCVLQHLSWLVDTLSASL